MSKTALTINPFDLEGVDDADEFADLCNAALRAEHPDVTFTEADDLNRLVAGNGYADVTSQIDYESVMCSTPGELAARLSSITRRIEINDFAEAPKWAQELDRQPATAEQIEASDNAEGGLIRIDVDGNVIQLGAFCAGETVTIWVD